MSLRAVLRAAPAIAVAILVAFAVPVSQLRTACVESWCCCPDPAHCHCPDREPDRDHQHDSMRACHRTSETVVSPQLPSFAAPVIAVADAPQRISSAPAAPLDAPHALVLAASPYGPS